MVIDGACCTTIVKACAGAVPTPLLAVIVPVKTPLAVAVPEMTPEDERLSPVGNAPAVTEKAGDGYPVDV